MELNTKHFGIIEIDENSIIDFPEGVPGFEYVKKFVLLGNPDDDSPFQWLQGVDYTDLAFAIIDPRFFKPDYEVDIDESDVEFLEIKDEKSVLIFAIVVVPEDLTKMTANLRAPILINVKNKKGKQVVMEHSNYEIRHYILDELRKAGV